MRKWLLSWMRQKALKKLLVLLKFFNDIFLLEIDDCLSQPCMNNGHCVDLKDDYHCECTAGYWGTNCEWEVDDCQFEPCANNATCLDKVYPVKKLPLNVRKIA